MKIFWQNFQQTGEGERIRQILPNSVQFQLASSGGLRLALILIITVTHPPPTELGQLTSQPPASLPEIPWLAMLYYFGYISAISRQILIALKAKLAYLKHTIKVATKLDTFCQKCCGQLEHFCPCVNHFKLGQLVETNYERLSSAMPHSGLQST